MIRDLLNDIRHRMRATFDRPGMEQELDDELRFHLEREAEKYVRAGMSPGEAARRARLAAQLYGVSATDPLSLAGAGALLLVVGALAALLPALRAARVNPVIALRHD